MNDNKNNHNKTQKFQTQETHTSLPDEEDERFLMQNVTVKFHISATQIVAQVYPNTITMGDIKTDIAGKFNVDPKHLVMTQWDGDLNDDLQLHEALCNDFGIVEFCLDIAEDAPSVDGVKPTLNMTIYYDKFRLADFITVHIPAEESNTNESKDILVEIQNDNIYKPFLGGYKDKCTNIEYHDAFSQTGPTPEQIRLSGIISRESQTLSKRTKSIDTTHENSAQAFGDSTKLIHVHSVSDFVIVPKKYQTYAELKRQENKIGKLILLQRNWRRFLIVRYMKNAAAEYRRLIAEQKRLEDKRMDKYVDQFQREATTKTFPRTKEDFDLLVTQVQRWKLGEIDRINQMYSDGPRIAELNLLLVREIELLNGIERQRNFVRQVKTEDHQNKVLEKMCETVKWVGYKDLVIEMDLLRTQRIRFLVKLYNDMRKTSKKAERLELLAKTTEIMNEEASRNDIPEIDDLLELILREKNLIMVSKYCDLEMLRKRQLVLLVEIIKYSKIPPKKVNPTKLCATCQQVKTINNFALLTRQTSVETCTHCFNLKSIASDNAVFRSILRSVQREERTRGSLTSYAFILQEDDIRYIITKIWHCHSILSKCTNPTELRLPRWTKDADWSPWNCICLTELEERNHKKISNLKDMYDDCIIQDIKSKHLLARTAFRRLQLVEYEFVESGDWWAVGIEDKVI